MLVSTPTLPVQRISHWAAINTGLVALLFAIQVLLVQMTAQSLDWCQEGREWRTRMSRTLGPSSLLPQ